MAEPVARHHRRWSTPALLLLPSAALMIYALVLPLLTFLRYSFYSNKGGRLREAFVFDAYREFLTDPYYHAVVSDTLWISPTPSRSSPATGPPGPPG